MNKQYIHRFILFSFILATILFALINAWYGFPFWKTAESSYSAISGHIPYSDASLYYHGIFLSALDGSLDAFNTRRPIYCLYFSCLQKISNFNFPLSILLQSCLFVIACSFFAFYISKKRGLNAALVSVLPITLLAMIYSPTTMSENSGLILALLSISVIYYAWHEQHIWFYRIGLCMFSIALSARSGCYFVLISFLLLPFFHPFKEEKYKELLWNILFIATGLFFVAMLSKIFGSHSGGYQANFSHTLYGLVTGGKTWSFVYNDPRVMHLLTGEERQHSKVIYEQSWIRFKENPFLLLWGLTKSLLRFIQFTFMNSWGGATQNIRYFYAFLHLCCMSIINWRFYENRNLYIRDFQFIIFSFIGILLSASVIWTDGGYRVFSTVAPIGGIFLALGIFPKTYAINQSNITSRKNICLGSIFMFLCITIIPVISFTKPMHITPPQEWVTSAHEENTYIVYNLKNQPGFIVTDQAKKFSRLAQLTKATFLKSLNQNDSPLGESLIKIANEMKQFYVISTYDFIRKNTFFFILENVPMAPNTQWSKLKVHTNIKDLLVARIEESK